MRILLMLFVAAGFLTVSCNNNKKKGEMTVVDKDGKGKTTIDISKAASSGEELTKKMEELKKLTPLTADQLKALLPEELVGMKRTHLEANSGGRYAVADATYRKDQNDEAYLSVSIVDCAGEAGAGYYSYGYVTQMNISRESDDGYTKTVDWNGSRAVETFDKSSNRYEVTYFSADRYLVVLKGGKTGLDLVKQAAQDLKLK